VEFAGGVSEGPACGKKWDVGAAADSLLPKGAKTGKGELIRRPARLGSTLRR